MGYSAHVGSFNIDTSKTATQTQAVTGVGFQPKVVLLWWSGGTATEDTVASGTIQLGFGAAVSTSSRWNVAAISIDAAATSDTRRSHFNTECMSTFTDAAGSWDGRMDFTSLDADGFTLVVDDQFANAYRVSYLALGGTDLTNVALGSKQTPAATGEYSITGVGFQPDAVILCSGVLDSVTDSYATARFSLGVATASDAQGTVFMYTQDGQSTSNTQGYGYNGEVLAPNASYRQAFVSMDEDGFTLDNLEGGSTYYLFYVALKGGQYLVGDLTTRTDSNDISETVGFEPAAVLFASANRALSTQDTVTDHARISIGAGTATDNRACAAISDEDALADTETAYANYDSAVYAHIVDDAIVGLMDIKSIDGSGFTCVMDDTDPSACWVTYLAIGAAGAAESTVTVATASYAVLKELYIVNTAGQAILKEVYTKTSAGQSFLQDRIINTAAGQAVLKMVAPVSAAGQAVLKEVYTKTTAAAATLKESVAGSAAGQAILKELYGFSVAGQAILKMAASASIAGQAVLKEAYGKTASAAAILKESVAGSAAGQAILKMTVPVASAVQAILKESVAGLQAMQAYLVDIGAVSTVISMAARLKEAVTKSAAVQAILKMAVTALVAGQAWLQDRISGTAAGRAILKQTASVAAAVNAYLLDVGGAAVTPDLYAPARGFTLAAAEREFTLMAPPRTFTLTTDERND